MKKSNNFFEYFMGRKGNFGLALDERYQLYYGVLYSKLQKRQQILKYSYLPRFPSILLLFAKGHSVLNSEQLMANGTKNYRSEEHTSELQSR